MINLAIKNSYMPILKQSTFSIKLKALKDLEYVRIFALPSKIKDRDIYAMFNGLIALLKEKIQQEQTEKYLQLKLKYNRLKQLYNKIKLN